METSDSIQTIHYLLRKSPETIEKLGNTLFDQLVSATLLSTSHSDITRGDCVRYIQNRVKGEYIKPLSVIYDGLAKRFPDVRFDESPPELDHAGDVDYLGYVGEKAFGIQIKLTTAKANFGNYSVSERMRASFAAFQADFSGKVFIVFSLDGEIGNPEILPEIANEIARLQT